MASTGHASAPVAKKTVRNYAVNGKHGSYKNHSKCTSSYQYHNESYDVLHLHVLVFRWKLLAPDRLLHKAGNKKIVRNITNNIPIQVPYLASDASFFSRWVSSKCVFSSEARTQIALLKRIVDGDSRFGECFTSQGKRPHNFRHEKDPGRIVEYFRPRRLSRTIRASKGEPGRICCFSRCCWPLLSTKKPTGRIFSFRSIGSRSLYLVDVIDLTSR
jgi:hypothetical protein